MKIRYERKIILNRLEFSDLRTFFTFLFERDTHTPTGKASYKVLSLYYDTPDNDYLFQKIDGDFEHNKIRLRSYGDTLYGSQTFLEHKFKKGGVMTKVRSPLQGDFNLNTPFNSINKNEIRDYFKYFFNHKKLAPTLGVSYQREAFEGVLDGFNMRINIDYDIRYQRAETFLPGYKHNSKSDYQEKDIVLEIKTENERIPAVILEKLQSCQSFWEAFSKYGNGRLSLDKN
jgi:SPX domain protein involved in polyphosphate accumulation